MVVVGNSKLKIVQPFFLSCYKEVEIRYYIFIHIAFQCTISTIKIYLSDFLLAVSISYGVVGIGMVYADSERSIIIQPVVITKLKNNRVCLEILFSNITCVNRPKNVSICIFNKAVLNFVFLHGRNNVSDVTTTKINPAQII